MRSLRRYLVLCAPLAMSVLFLELVLEVAGRASEAAERVLMSPWTPNTVPDDRLVFRPNPDHPEHDDRGFRNPVVPERAEVVAFGDSWTYGLGVRPEDSWPRQLAAQSGRTVYNVSYGGYGPVHSLLLWEEGMSLQPAVVVEAVFLGNDLYDAFILVYHYGQLPELRTTDEALRERIRSAEARESLADRVNQLIDNQTLAEAEASLASDRGEDSSGVVAWLSEHSNLYSLLRRTKFEAIRAIETWRRPVDHAWQSSLAHAARYPGCCHILEGNGFRTIMSGRYRLAALDLGDLRVEEGLGITQRVLQRMHAAASSRGIEFVVMLLPTKELVFREHWTDPPDDFQLIIENELVVHERLSTWLGGSRIDYIDGLSVLRAELAQGRQPFPESRDSHPNAVGYAALARKLADHLERTPGPTL